MHFIIVGSGRVGRLLVDNLLSKEHTVTLISSDQSLLDLVPQRDGLTKINGIPFDADVLKRAKIDSAVGLASVTDDDNLNILVTRVAKINYNVNKVVVRVYDRSKAEVFAKLGIPTVSTIHWTVDNVLRELIPLGVDSQFVDVTGNIVLSQADFDESWCGVNFETLERITKARVAFVERFGKAILINGNDILQDGDKLHLLIPTKTKEEIPKILLKPYKLSSNTKNTDEGFVK